MAATAHAHGSGSPPRLVAPRVLDVLVVDDDESSRVALCAAVALLGHRGRVAASGAEALRAHRDRRADVIVSDWSMPGMDGMELCRQVRTMDGGDYTYLLFTSGQATKRDFVEAVRAGADDYLAKPVDLDELEARLLAADRVVSTHRELAERNVNLRHDSQNFFQAARVDPLTRLSNRLRLDEDLATLQAEVSRYRRNVSVAMCDLDGFKRYNDHYGHLAGDEALRRIADAISTSLRRADHVYRYGGEEFLVVLPEQEPGRGQAAMNRVRMAVEGLGIAHAPGTPHTSLTVSIGLAAISSRDEHSVQEAIEHADRAMYQAKAAGGNKLTVWHGGPH
jgi:two-component system cell cycle response regulator